MVIAVDLILEGSLSVSPWWAWIDHQQL